MRGLLVRVGADTSRSGGGWNAPFDSVTSEFVYAPIPESEQTKPGLERHFEEIEPALAKMHRNLPRALKNQKMHLDPDFERLTYGDRNLRGKTIGQLKHGDFLAFYAGMRDVRGRRTTVVCALIGIFIIYRIELATIAAQRDPCCNAHTRRILCPEADDIVVFGSSNESGRFERGILVGTYRDRAQRVLPEVLEAWGGLSVRDGYIQRSGKLPEFLMPDKFRLWLRNQHVSLKASNS